ncbi:MAG: TetR family transcriptional regulator [Pseudomonadota bacterium]
MTETGSVLKKEERGRTVRETILDKAEELILSLPNGKLRLVDIAGALGMSHANIYRHFKNRDDVLGAMVERWLSDGEVRAEQAIAASGSAGEGIKAMLLALHTDTKRKIASAPGVIDIYVHAIEKKADAVQAHRQFLIHHAIELLQAGVSAGEFAISPEQFPKILTVLEHGFRKFTHPYMIAETLDEDTAAQAEAVLDVMVGALRYVPDVYR